MSVVEYSIFSPQFTKRKGNSRFIILSKPERFVEVATVVESNQKPHFVRKIYYYSDGANKPNSD